MSGFEHHRKSDRVIATCSDEVFELVRQGADRRRLSVVPCGVDTARFTPDGPAEPANLVRWCQARTHQVDIDRW